MKPEVEVLKNLLLKQRQLEEKIETLREKVVLKTKISLGSVSSRSEKQIRYALSKVNDENYKFILDVTLSWEDQDSTGGWEDNLYLLTLFEVVTRDIEGMAKKLFSLRREGGISGISEVGYWIGNSLSVKPTLEEFLIGKGKY